MLLWFICVALVISCMPVGAQEADESADTGSSTVEEGTGSTIKKTTPSLPSVKGAGGLFKKIIGYVSKIGGIFGRAAGVRIGGTSGSAIIMLIAAFLLRDRVPPWIRYLLLAGGGTMIAGGSANIIQMLMMGNIY